MISLTSTTTYRLGEETWDEDGEAKLAGMQYRSEKKVRK